MDSTLWKVAPFKYPIMLARTALTAISQLPVQHLTGDEFSLPYYPPETPAPSTPVATPPTYNKLPNTDKNIKQLLALLDVKRAEDRGLWINLGLALKNTSDTLLPLWIEFSQKSEKFVVGECEKLWNGFPPVSASKAALTMGSLIFWARQDNPEGFKAIQRENIINYILQAVSGLHTDVAKVVYRLYQGRFVYVNIPKGSVWYEFANHRWQVCPNAATLNALISSEVFSEFQRVVSMKHKEASVNSDDAVATFAGALNKVSLQLKRFSYKDQLIKECQVHFGVTHEFIKQLDEQKNLLGFDNGVFDIDTDTFRDGKPDDMLTMSVGYDYVGEYDTIIQKTLLDFMFSLMPTKELTLYLLTRAAYALHGNKWAQELSFWVGTGANGKGALSQLLQYTFGEYCYNPDVSIITCKRQSSSSANGELLLAKGKRLMIVSEPSEDDKFQLGALKSWSGNDKIQARGLYQSPVEFSPQFSLICMMNNQPTLNGFDSGFARRLQNVQFPYKFVAKPDPANSFERQCDPSLTALFQTVEVRQQFMLMLLSTYHHYVKDKTVLETPPEVLEFTKSYLDQMDAVGQFLKEHVDITNDKDDMILFIELYNDFKTSAYYNDLSKCRFSSHLSGKGIKTVLGKKGMFRDKRVYSGMRLKNPNYTETDDIDNCDFIDD
jgi:P4 family phage/plasmid primase-like protien